MSQAHASIKRPSNVTAVGVLVITGAILQFLAALAAFILAGRPGEVQRLYGSTVSDWFWIITGTLSFLLALIYVWIARGVFFGNSQAWMLVNMLAIINLVFAVFQVAVGTGWIAILLNVIILAMNNTSSARAWFRTG